MVSQSIGTVILAPFCGCPVPVYFYLGETSCWNCHYHGHLWKFFMPNPIRLRECSLYWQASVHHHGISWLAAAECHFVHLTQTRIGDRGRDLSPLVSRHSDLSWWRSFLYLNSLDILLDSQSWKSQYVSHLGGYMIHKFGCILSPLRRFVYSYPLFADSWRTAPHIMI